MFNATTLVSRSVQLGNPAVYVSFNYRVNGFTLEVSTPPLSTASWMPTARIVTLLVILLTLLPRFHQRVLSGFTLRNSQYPAPGLVCIFETTILLSRYLLPRQSPVQAYRCFRWFREKDYVGG